MAADAALDDAALVKCVRPYAPRAVQGRSVTPESARLMQGYYDSIAAWANVLARHFVPVPGHPDWGYYGEGGNGENEVRPITYAVQVNAFMSVVQPPSGGPDAARRARARREAIAALEYLTQAHVTGGGACLNGKPWGNQWQSALWARAAGLGGWMLWPDLNDRQKAAIARLVEFEADRFIGQSPKNSEIGDTGAEENAWNAMLIGLAANMMPAHPHAGDWAHAAKVYMYNSLSRRADAQDDTLGDDGRPVRDWVTTVNAHPDFTVENHRLVHVGYLKLTVGELLDTSVHYLLTDAPVPRACLHGVAGANEVLLHCMAWDAAPIAFGGNDWKITHTQCTDILQYAFLNLLKGDAVAAHLEVVALDMLRRIQQDEGGFYNPRRDLEYGGLCSTRLVSCYLAHALVGKTTPPASADEFNRRASGVTFLRDGKAIVHRTPTKFASFTWGPRRLALALPKDGAWVVWPHFASYLGTLDGKDPSQGEATIEALQPWAGTSSFTVTGRLARAKGQIKQDFAYASPAGDMTVYIERLSTVGDAQLESRETGIIGFTYALGENERTLTGRHGVTRAVGLGGGDTVTPMPTDWLNIGGQVGYVVRRQSGRTNLMRYHGEERGTGRVPILQEYVSLVGETEPDGRTGTDWACVVTFLNQSAKETADWSGRVDFEVDGDTATCRCGQETIHVDFKAMQTTIQGPGAEPQTTAKDTMKVFVLAGQSNMAGKAVPGALVEKLKPFPTNVQLHTNYGWGPLRYAKTFGPELSFGVALGEAWPEQQIGLVKYAVDGTSLATRWHPRSGDLYAKLIARVRAATAELTARGLRVELTGVIWMQGESDMTRQDWADAYAENFTALIRQLRADLGQPELPFIFGHTFGVKYAYPDTVRAAQLACSRALPNVRVVYNDDLPRHPVDLIHLTEPGEIELGRRFARALLTPANHPTRAAPRTQPTATQSSDDAHAVMHDHP